MTTPTELRDQLAAEAGGPTRAPEPWDDITRRGRHRRQMRRVQNLALSAAVVAGVAVGAMALSADDERVDTGPAATDGAPTVPEEIDPSTVLGYGDAEIGAARAERSSITLFFGDPDLCRAIRPVVVESEGQITVGLVGAQDRRGVPWAGCGGGVRGLLDPWGRIDLAAPVADRSLVDLSTGQTVDMKDSAELLFPTSLPAPFDLEVFDQDNGGLFGGADDWIFTFPGDGSQSVYLSNSADLESNGTGCDDQVVEVRGTEGCFVPGGLPSLAWDEDGRSIYLSITGADVGESALDELLAIAQGLEPLDN